MDSEPDRTEESQQSAEESTGALDEDNPSPSEDAGQKGAGTRAALREGWSAEASPTRRTRDSMSARR